MKKLLFIGALLCVLCSCGSGNGGAKKSDEDVVKEDRSEYKNFDEELLNSPTTGTHNGHEWVDLGLSVKWATCNVGASTPGDYGSYYAWGETRTKSNYDNCASYGKSWSDIAGNSSRDAARANWGGSWRMPTEAEFEELKDKCTWTWTTQNGKNGYKVTGPNGNSIFLPAAGFLFGGALSRDGEHGRFWSSTPDESRTDNAYYLYFDEGRRYVECYSRSDGRSVRPVLSDAAGKLDELLNPPTGTHEGHEWVDLGLSIKWATCNVGASTPGDYGNYYAWGETSTKSEYTESNSASYGKSWDDIGGNPSCDAARANWGGSWRMPTKAEFEELKDNCTWTWTTQNGKNGYKVTGPKGNIFLPAAGYRCGDKLINGGEGGYFWGSTPYGSYTEVAYYLYFDEGGQYVDWLFRYFGRSVRPVLED